MDVSSLARSPIIWMGGKSKLAKRIIPHFARAWGYCEPFFGGGSVFFGLPPGTYKQELVNDKHKEIVNFFKQLRENTDELHRQLMCTPWARDELLEAQQDLSEPVSDIERARRFWIRCRLAHVADAPSGWKCDHRPSNNGRTIQTMSYTSLDELHAYAKRIHSAAIDNRDALDLLPLLDGPSWMIYADPPYVLETRKATTTYVEEPDSEFHLKLLSELKRQVTVGNKVAISGYRTPLYERELAGWRTFSCGAGQSKAEKNTGIHTAHREELLWMSYPESEELGESVFSSRIKAATKQEAELLALHRARGRR